MKQSDDPKAFFEKYKFTLTYSLPHPTHKDMMEFDGLEANYVSGLEREVKHLKNYIELLQGKIEYLMSQDYYLYKEKLKREGFKEENE